MSERHEPNPDTITMYGADWCGDCIRAKSFFDANEMAFDYVDLVEHPHETDVVLEHNGGVRKIPLVLYPDGSFQIEPTNDELEAKRLELAASENHPVDEHTSEAPLHDVIENADEGRFELHVNGEIVSVAEYSERAGGQVVIPHVSTDPAHRGQGHAGRLMDGVLSQLRSSERKIVPVCPFAAHHINTNPHHQDLVA